MPVELIVLMSILVHTYFVPRGLSSYAPSYDCWRGFFEVPSGTADNSPPFLTVGCPHHKTIPVPQPRDERIPGPIVLSRFLPRTGRTLQRLRFMAHELRSGFARWDFFRPWRDLFRCLPQTTVINGGLLSAVPTGLQETVRSAAAQGTNHA